MRVRPESVTHLVVKLFNVKSKALCKLGIFVYFIHKSIVLYVYFHMSHKNVLY
jgi:hypothetical protein